MAGPIVLQEESPWTQLLGGIGQGLAEGTKIGLQQRQQELDLEKEILVGTATGKYDVKIWASKAGRDFLKAAKLEKRPGIQNLIRSGEALLPQASGSSIDGKTVTTPHGDLVNIPLADEYYLKHGVSDPSKAMETEGVTNILEAEGLAKKMHEAQLEGNLIYQRQSMLDAIRWERSRGTSDPTALINATKQALTDAGGDMNDWTITANSKGQVSVTYNKDTSGRITANKSIELSESFDREARGAAERRTGHIRGLSGILAGDVSLAGVDVDEGDAVAMALKQAAEAISSAKGGAKRIMERSTRVKAILKSVNEEIAVTNKSIANAGKRAGRSQQEIESSLLKPITFEDVSGGVSEADWLKDRAKEERPAKDLISEIRGTPIENRPSSGGFGAGRPESDAKKLKRVYDGVKDVVQAAVASNPTLTSDDIKNTILSMKRDIMAEYGLNERLWSMLIQMSNKVLG